METVTVIAFDPGETTGWCVMTVDVENLTDVNTRPLHEAVRHEPGEWRWEQIDSKALGSLEAGVGADRGHAALNFDGEIKAVDAMVDLLCARPDAVVVLESFVLDPKQASGKFNLLAPVRIISSFSYAMVYAGFGLEQFYLINRGDPKRTCTDDRLKHWGFGGVVSHRSRHACDATRIAYYFLRDCRGNSEAAREKRWRAWPHKFSDPQVRTRGNRKPRELGERI